MTEQNKGLLLTPEEREFALDGMRVRAKEVNPSLDDCIYIGAVYELAKARPIIEKPIREESEARLEVIRRLTNTLEELQVEIPKLNKKLDDREADLIEAKREERERIQTILIDYAIEQGKKRFSSIINSPDFWRALKGSTR